MDSLGLVCSRSRGLRKRKTINVRKAFLRSAPNAPMMDSDDDEIYGSHPSGDSKTEVKMEDAEDQEEGEEVESSDDDVNFITDAKEEPKPKKEEAAHIKRPDSISRTLSESRARSSTPQPSASRNAKRGSIKEEAGTPDDNKPGSEYPPVHVSKINPDGNPIHPATGKPIFSTDFDQDFPTESSKPWRKPGADQTDYFNYGFDEFSFASFTLRQQQMPQTVTGIRKENEEMQQFVQQLGNNGMPVPTGPSGGAAANAGGVPDMTPEQMQQMQQMMMMMGGGGNPMMGGDGGMMGQNQPPTGPQGGFHGGYDHGGPGGGFGGRGRGRRGRGNW